MSNGIFFFFSIDSLKSEGVLNWLKPFPQDSCFKFILMGHILKIHTLRVFFHIVIRLSDILSIFFIKNKVDFGHDIPLSITLVWHNHKYGHCSRCWRICEWEIGWISPLWPSSVIDSGKSWPESIFLSKKLKNATLSLIN